MPVKKISQTGSLRAGELARLTGVSTDTLRHYERKGLLQSLRSANGYRAYPQHAVDRVMLIRNALAIGFGLDELSRILKIRDNGGAPCRQVRAMFAAKLNDLEILLDEMTAMRNELVVLLQDWDKVLESADSGIPSRLLESLATSDHRRRPGHHSIKALSPKRKPQENKNENHS